MLQKARQEKHGSHSSTLARWNNDHECRNSLSLIGWTEQDIMLFDRIAMESHSYVATKAERIRNSTHWILKLHQEGAKTQQDCRTIPRSQQLRQRKGQAFEGIEEYDYAVDLHTGWRFKKESGGDLPAASSSSTNWDRNNWKTSSWNSKHSSWSDDS